MKHLLSKRNDSRKDVQGYSCTACTGYCTGSCASGCTGSCSASCSGYTS